MKVKRIVCNTETSDLNKAAAFYRDILGLDLIMDHGWFQTYGSDAKMTVQVSFGSDGGSCTSVPALSIEVDDLDAALERVEKAKIPVEYGLASEPRGVRRFYVRDPFGKLINVLQHELGSVSTDCVLELHMTEKGDKTPELTRGRWWKLPLTFLGLWLITFVALGCLTLITATTDDQAQLVILSIPAQRAWLIAILGGAVGGLARALYQFLVDNYAFHYLRIAGHSSPWAMKVYGFKDDKEMEDDYDPLESWQLFFSSLWWVRL